MSTSWTYRLITALLSFALVAILPPQPAAACQPLSLSVASNLVFSGTALAGDAQATTFSIERVYFGVWSQPTIEVRLGLFGMVSSSGFRHPEFTTGQVYTVYGQLQGGVATTGACAPTHPGLPTADTLREFTLAEPFPPYYYDQTPQAIFMMKSNTDVCNTPVYALSETPGAQFCIPGGTDVWYRSVTLGGTNDVLYVSVMSDKVAKPHTAFGLTGLGVHADPRGQLWLTGRSGDVGPARYVVAQRLYGSGSTLLLLRLGEGRTASEGMAVLLRYVAALVLPYP